MSKNFRNGLPPAARLISSICPILSTHLCLGFAFSFFQVFSNLATTTLLKSIDYWDKRADNKEFCFPSLCHVPVFSHYWPLPGDRRSVGEVSHRSLGKALLGDIFFIPLGKMIFLLQKQGTLDLSGTCDTWTTK